jgi:hypothetical protein
MTVWLEDVHAGPKHVVKSGKGKVAQYKNCKCETWRWKHQHVFSIARCYDTTELSKTNFNEPNVTSPNLPKPNITQNNLT